MAVLSRSLKAYKRLRRDPNAAAALALAPVEGQAAPAAAGGAKVDGVVTQDLTRGCSCSSAYGIMHRAPWSGIRVAIVVVVKKVVVGSFHY